LVSERKKLTMCNYFFKPLDNQHAIEVHGHKETNNFHAICLDCNVYLLPQGTEEQALEAKAKHVATFQDLAELEPFSMFMPRCACYSEYLGTLDEPELDAQIDLAYDIEEFIFTRMSEGTWAEQKAALLLEGELLRNPTSLKDAKAFYMDELYKLI